MARIIVGVDGSDYAVAALKWAVARGQRDSLGVVAFMAWNTFDQGHHEKGEKLAVGFDDSDAQRILAATVARADLTDLVETRTVNGVAAEALVETAKPEDLIVVGARGLGGFKGLLLGSVSSRVLELAAGPVAVVHGTEVPPSTGDIVVGVDGSPASLDALGWAADEARAARATLRIVSAWQAPLYPELAVPQVLEALEGGVRDEVAAIAGDPHLADLTVMTETPCAAPTAALVAHGDAAMLVVGRRGAGVLARLFLGSVSRQVAQHATVPVVVV